MRCCQEASASAGGARDAADAEPRCGAVTPGAGRDSHHEAADSGRSPNPARNTTSDVLARGSSEISSASAQLLARPTTGTVAARDGSNTAPAA